MSRRYLTLTGDRARALRQAARLPNDPRGDHIAALVAAISTRDIRAMRAADSRDASLMLALTYMHTTHTII